MRRPALAAAALLLSAAATPPIMGPLPPAPPPPPLVITIQVDGLTGELFDEYRSAFTGGLKRLASGTVFRNGYQASSGAQSLGTVLKRLSPDSQSIVVSGKPVTAGALGDVDQLYYWSNDRFVTDAARPPQPRTPALANAAVTAMIASAEAPLPVPSPCLSKAGAGPRFTRAAGDRAGFAASPALDGATLALAAGLVGELGLGRDRAPDVVAITLSSTANVASRTGADAAATCVQLMSLDRDLGGFFGVLDRAGLYYAVALTGGDGSTERRRVPMLFWRAGMVPTERLEAVETIDVTPTLGALTGIPVPQAVPGKCLGGVQGITCQKP